MVDEKRINLIATTNVLYEYYFDLYVIIESYFLKDTHSYGIDEDGEGRYKIVEITPDPEVPDFCTQYKELINASNFDRKILDENIAKICKDIFTESEYKHFKDYIIYQVNWEHDNIEMLVRILMNVQIASQLTSYIKKEQLKNNYIIAYNEIGYNDNTQTPPDDSVKPTINYLKDNVEDCYFYESLEQLFKKEEFFKRKVREKLPPKPDKDEKIILE